MDDIWRKGESRTIEWESVGVNGNVGISYSANHFRIWLTIRSELESQGAHNWVVSPIAGMNS